MINHDEKNVWRVFSKFIRLRDANWQGYISCISCSIVRPLNDGMDAGHFIDAGSDKALKYNELNVNGQCRSCNYFKSGNKLEYRRNLIQKIGEKEVIKLEQAHYFKTTHKKLNQLQLNAMFDFYKKKIKDLSDNKEKIKPYATIKQ